MLLITFYLHSTDLAQHFLAMVVESSALYTFVKLCTCTTILTISQGVDRVLHGDTAGQLCGRILRIRSVPCDRGDCEFPFTGTDWDGESDRIYSNDCHNSTDSLRVARHTRKVQRQR